MLITGARPFLEWDHTLEIGCCGDAVAGDLERAEREAAAANPQEDAFLGALVEIAVMAKHLLALAKLADDLPLFSAAGARPAAASPSPVNEALAGLRPDELTPKEALEFLYRLKGMVGDR